MMRGKLPAIFGSALAALVLASSFARATQAQTRDARTATPSTATQSPTTRDAQTPRAEEPEAQPDLSITARVTADSLRFEKVPNPSVEFTGKPRRETVWQSERQNLPRQVQPGVTYRDIGITLRITSVFADIDRIVAEALGEAPMTDDAQPASTPPTQPAPATPAQPETQSDAQPQAASELQESRTSPTPSPAKAPTRANARGRAGRRGRGR